MITEKKFDIYEDKVYNGNMKQIGYLIKYDKKDVIYSALTMLKQIYNNKHKEAEEKYEEYLKMKKKNNKIMSFFKKKIYIGPWNDSYVDLTEEVTVESFYDEIWYSEQIKFLETLVHNAKLYKDDFIHLSNEGVEKLGSYILKAPEIEEIEKRVVASCNCLTKTPEHEHHKKYCKYKMLMTYIEFFNSCKK